MGHYTYNTWRGKHTVKHRHGPYREPTGPQRIWIDLLIEVSALWQGYAQDIRDMWNHFAAEHREPHWSGQDTRLTGHNWYVRTMLLKYLLMSTYGAPDLPTLPSIGLDTIEAVPIAPYVYVNWTYTSFPDEDNHFLDLWLNGPHSPGRKADIKMIKHSDSTIIPDLTIALYTPASGTYDLFYRIVHRSGGAGVFQTIRFVVA